LKTLGIPAELLKIAPVTVAGFAAVVAAATPPFTVANSGAGFGFVFILLTVLISVFSFLCSKDSIEVVAGFAFGCHHYQILIDIEYWDDTPRQSLIMRML
jgi:hypothetical protein